MDPGWIISHLLMKMAPVVYGLEHGMQELFVMIPKQKKYHITTAPINTGQKDLLQQMVGVLLHHVMVCCGFRPSITETIMVPNFFELILCKQTFLLRIWERSEEHT